MIKLLFDGTTFSEPRHFKDTHREKAPSYKTPAIRKSTNMGVWAVGTLNQLFVKGCLTGTKLSKKIK